MTSIKRWMSFVKFSHTLFSLPFALIGFSLAFLKFPTNQIGISLVLMFLAIVFARNAAMAFNRYADRKIDKKNVRTAQREIPANVISPERAIFFIVLNILFFEITAYLINPLAFYLTPIALLVVIGYSYSKRFTWLCHYILGLGLAIAPIGAYIVIAKQFDVLPLVLSAAVFFWVGGFDILYALQDEDFDKKEQLHSIPQRFGRKKALLISAVSHLFSIAFLFYFGALANVTWIYWVGFTLFSLMLVWEHLVVKPNDISKVNMAFATLNASASVVFAIFTIADLFSFYLLS